MQWQDIRVQKDTDACYQRVREAHQHDVMRHIGKNDWLHAEMGGGCFHANHIHSPVVFSAENKCWGCLRGWRWQRDFCLHCLDVYHRNWRLLVLQKRKIPREQDSHMTTSSASW